MAYAILIIDMQKGFFLNDYKDQVFSKQVERSVVAQIQRLLAAARPAGVPVYHVITSYKADRSDWTLRMKDINYQVCIEGTEGVEIVPGVEPQPGDEVVIKTRYSGFFKTGLDEKLKAGGIDTIITVGINAHACIRSTVIDGFMNDYRVIVPEECIGCYDPAHHQITLNYIRNRIARVIGVDELIAQIQRGSVDFRFS